MLELSGGLSQPQTSILIIVFALAMTLVLSLLIVLTYDKTSRQVSRPDHFIQSLLLMSLVTCTIMQSIGDSLALSFGIFGALAIIRFRTRISDPEMWPLSLPAWRWALPVAYTAFIMVLLAPWLFVWWLSSFVFHRLVKIQPTGFPPV
ncbi:MAG: hypothetical protein IPP37_16835 [Saprospiraceae bacterium]|nr:hypothetical protein [Saprospiraceae bacterium]